MLTRPNSPPLSYCVCPPPALRAGDADLKIPPLTTVKFDGSGRRHRHRADVSWASSCAPSARFLACGNTCRPRRCRCTSPWPMCPTRFGAPAKPTCSSRANSSPSSGCSSPAAFSSTSKSCEHKASGDVAVILARLGAGHSRQLRRGLVRHPHQHHRQQPHGLCRAEGQPHQHRQHPAALRHERRPAAGLRWNCSS